MKNKTVLLLPLRSMLFIVAGMTVALVIKSTLAEISKWWTTIDIVINIITIAILLIMCRSKGTTYGRFINFEKGKSGAKAVFVGFAIVLVVSMAGMYGAGFILYGEIPHFPVMMIQPIPIWLAIASIILLPMTTTLAEDGIYLGVLNQTDSNAALLASIFFYAAQHCFSPLIPDIRYMIDRFISFLPAAAVMCCWYRKNKNPLPLMVGHLIVNIPTIVMLIATSASPGLFEQWIN
jgi:membrane protease YdiL (CAAX protease family)